MNDVMKCIITLDYFYLLLSEHAKTWNSFEYSCFNAFHMDRISICFTRNRAYIIDQDINLFANVLSDAFNWQRKANKLWLT